MDHVQYLNRLLEPYEPQLSVDRLVEEVNRLYHSCEAGSYDDRHPILRGQLAAIWSTMIQHVISTGAEGPWDVLDFGCGTGFASKQIISLLPAGQLRSVTCYDPSPEMLELCQEHLKPLYPEVRITRAFDDLKDSKGKFNLILTNSVLHHLSDPLKTIHCLTTYLSDDAIWLCGHEPSKRFYQNPACVELFRQYEHTRRWQRYFQPRAYVRRAARSLGLIVDPAAKAAIAAHRRGYFGRRPPRRLVSQIVDFHVACSAHDVECGRGFDVHQLQAGLRDAWSLDWHRTYNFLGSTWEGNASTTWRVRCDALRQQFPDDGADFCSIWRRTAIAGQRAV